MSRANRQFTVLAQDVQFLAGSDDQSREIVWAAYLDPRYEDVGVIRGLKSGLLGGEVRLWDDVSWGDCTADEIADLTQQKMDAGFTALFRGTLYFDPQEGHYFAVDQASDHYLNKGPDAESLDETLHVDRSKIPDDLDFRK